MHIASRTFPEAAFDILEKDKSVVYDTDNVISFLNNKK